MSSDLFAVILAGGSGERFWPASRAARPKQFLSVSSDRSLLADTFVRLEGLVPAERVIVVTSERHADLVHEVLPQLPRENVLREPIGRNTLPCAAFAAFEIERRAPGSVALLLPADHAIEPAAAFRAALERIANTARDTGSIVLLGVKPRHPATGYGYIELASTPGEGAAPVARFVEKPDLEHAERYLAGGRHLWNCGVFAWRNDVFLDLLREHAPDIHTPLAGATTEQILKAYPDLPRVSIDVGLLEQRDDLMVLPLDCSWSDVGSWRALSEVVAADANGHAALGGAQVLSEDARDCIVYGPDGSLTALLGVEGLVVVRSGDATLVCPRERAEEVRAIASRLAEEAPDFR